MESSPTKENVALALELTLQVCKYQQLSVSIRKYLSVSVELPGWSPPQTKTSLAPDTYISTVTSSLQVSASICKYPQVSVSVSIYKYL